MPQQDRLTFLRVNLRQECLIPCTALNARSFQGRVVGKVRFRVHGWLVS